MIEGIEKYYTMTLRVMRNIPVSNGMGGWVDHFSEHLEIAGLIRPLSGAETRVADKLLARTTHVLYCGIHDILETDIIMDEDDNEYKVLEPPRNMMNMGNHLQTNLEWVR